MVTKKVEINSSARAVPLLDRLAILSLIGVVLLVYLAPFWWFEHSSRQASWVRIGLVIATGLFLYSKKGSLKNHFLQCDGYFTFSLFLLFIYLLLNALVLSESFKPISRLFFIILLFVSASFITLNEKNVRALLWCIVVTAAGFALLSLANHYINDTLPKGYRLGGLIDSGFLGWASFGNTIIAGMHYAFALSIAFYLFFTEEKLGKLITAAFLAAVLFTYIVLTFARTAWIAVFISFFVILVLTFNRREKRFYIVFLCALLVLIYFSINHLGYEVHGRGLTRRDDIWRASIQKIEQSWFFGYGLLNKIGWIVTESGQKFNNSHSLYLEIVYQTGLVGLLLYLHCILWGFVRLLQAYKMKVYGQLSVLLIAILTAISVVMTVDIIGWINSPDLVWMWLWVPLAFVSVLERRILSLRK